MSQEQIAKIVIVGHVDHGKSTLLGRILMDCGQLPEDRIAQIKKVCQEKGVPLEPAFFLDALKEEQEQGISIDTTRVRFQFQDKKYVLIDAPGHVEFLKNMATGASEAELGILVIDSTEGIRVQTERHLRVLSVLGINKVVVAVNKLDKIGYSQEKFAEISSAIATRIKNENLNCLGIVPVSALNGENILEVSENFGWYFGQALLPLVTNEVAQRQEDSDSSVPFRMVLQDVYKFDDQRYFAGRIVSGVLKAGSQISFSPSGKMATVAAICQYPNKQLSQAKAGESVALVLSEQVFVERGEVISLSDQLPETDTEITAQIAWVTTRGFEPSAEYILKVGTNEVGCTIHPISGIIDSESRFAQVAIRSKRPFAFDRESGKGLLNKLVICSTYETCAFGAIDKTSTNQSEAKAPDLNVTVETGYVERAEFESFNKHKGAVIWLTGLSGSGKSSLAKSLQRTLFEKGMHAVVLDGDNLRHGICADLGFTREERSKNVRRVAHTAKLFLESGSIAIVAVISPYQDDREAARKIIGDADFNEIFVFCPIEVCEARDPKGLYAKARTGKLQSFSGHDSPYQPPQTPDLRLDSSKLGIEDEVAAIVELLKRRGFEIGNPKVSVATPEGEVACATISNSK